MYKKIVELYQEPDIEEVISKDTNGGSYIIKLSDEEIEKLFEDLKQGE
ncbi:hypothetical protein GCM10022410_24430 [Amphibacillus indicireducens]|uniref:Uncharacterized protein n=1 Tax=Amphibacillus indicireducens TaxID=1076330 RepID=A0ABP7W1Z6_9BACI